MSKITLEERKKAVIFGVQQIVRLLDYRHEREELEFPVCLAIFKKFMTVHFSFLQYLIAKLDRDFEEFENNENNLSEHLDIIFKAGVIDKDERHFLEDLALLFCVIAYEKYEGIAHEIFLFYIHRATTFYEHIFSKHDLHSSPKKETELSL